MNFSRKTKTRIIIEEEFDWADFENSSLKRTTSLELYDEKTQSFITQSKQSKTINDTTNQIIELQKIPCIENNFVNYHTNPALLNRIPQPDYTNHINHFLIGIIIMILFAATILILSGGFFVAGNTQNAIEMLIIAVFPILGAILFTVEYRFYNSLNTKS